MKKPINLDDIITEKDIENYNKNKSVKKQEEYVYAKDKEGYFTQIEKSKLTDKYTVITKEEYVANVYVKEKLKGRKVVINFTIEQTEKEIITERKTKKMSNGKITIESGKYKSIITIKNNEQNADIQDVKVEFEPALENKIEQPSDEIAFVVNVTHMFTNMLKNN